LQLPLFSGLAFFICLPLMKRTLTVSLDMDWFYRRFLGVLCWEFPENCGKALTSAPGSKSRHPGWCLRKSVSDR
jgi:hypothetical protein